MSGMTDRDRVADAALRQLDPAAGRPERPLWPMALPVALTALFFWPITRNYFFGDDLLAVYETIHKPLVGFLFEPYGGHVMATRNVVYLLLYHLFGPNPTAYYLIALLTHLLNVGLLFLIIRDLTSTRLACFGAAFWGAAPIHAGPLGWYQAYGVVMAVTAQLWVVHRLVRIRSTNRLNRLEVLSWGLLLLGASTSFGTGIAITMAMPGIAWLLLPPTPTRWRATLGLALVAACVAAGYFGLQRLAAYLFSQEQINIAMVAVDQWRAVLWGAWLLMIHGVTVLLLGPLAHYASIAHWCEYALTAAALVAVGAGFAVANAEERRLMIACLLPFGIGYLMIAAGRAVFLVQYGPRVLEQAHYHYTAPLTLAILAAVVLAALSRRWRPSAAASSVMLALWYVTFAAVQLTAGPAIAHHDTERELADQTLAQIKALVLSRPPGSDVYIRNRLFFGVGPFVLTSPETFPGIAGLFAVYYPDQLLEGRRVFFVERNPRVLNALRDRPFAGMLTAPENVPAGGILHIPPGKPMWAVG
jgi:hypothetical protein